ncbi:MAG TPA: hypothetical protein VLK82_19635 [Candidatus Tectomicrobia bacterium]|nr:hypothetical protein [Candidatus Tectomicrobia bacterium]
MLTAYVNAAMRKARNEILSDGEGYFGISLNGDDEYKDWLRISQSALEQAYSSDEPTYSLDAIKEPNPDHERS